MADADSEPSVLASRESVRAAERFYHRELVPRLTRLRRGKRVYVHRADGNGFYVAASFAGIYAVVVWFCEEFDRTGVQATILRLLPPIQSLTLALPPWDGPGCDEGSKRARA